MNGNFEAVRRTERILSKTPQLKDEIAELAATGRLNVLNRLGISSEKFEAALLGQKRAAVLETMGAGLGGSMPGLTVEAIVRVVGRPPLLVRNGTYESPPTKALRAQLEPHRKRINQVIASVGRIEFRFHRLPWGGTGWMIDQKIAVTNRHVAELVAETNWGGGFRFKASPIGRSYEARIDYREEKDNPIAQEARLVRVKFIATHRQPDLALFEVESDFPLPPPILLSDQPITEGLDIGVVGYPADDPYRNDPDNIKQYFGDIFDVKRFAAGEVSQAPDDGILMHDATTLGGNSGSVVFDLATGQAVGLHFAGEFKVGNYAIDARTVKRVLKGLKTVVMGADLITEKRDGQHHASFFKGRDGYDPGFLGLPVPLPGLNQLAADAAEATEADGQKTKVLNYRHFSVQYSRSRKVPILTAVNIDGEKSRKVKRGDDQWFQDLRLPQEIQLGEKDYGRNVIDRGHMVRREDPVWGSPDEAVQANFDTFHYTNAAPQHADLNQRATAWLGLENYILENTRTKGLKVSVFTGPVLRPDDPSDPDFPRLGPIPREFWKIVAAIDAETGKLYATGFVLSQGKMIADLTEAIVFGDWNSYQVPISMIAQATGLDFSALQSVDTFPSTGKKKKKKPSAGKGRPKKRKRGAEEMVEATAPILITSPEDIYLGAGEE